MAVPEQIPYVGYIANGVTKEFPITFDLHDDRYLVVTVNKEKPTVGSYTVSNGKVLFLTAPENNAQVELYRSTTLDRDIDYKSYDNSFRPAAINFDFDKTWQVLQEQHMVDAQLLARVKEEVEWRRVNDTLLQGQIDILNQVILGVFEKASNEYLTEKLKELQDAIDIAAAAGAGANGWTASLVVDGNETQHQINNSLIRTYNSVSELLLAGYNFKSVLVKSYHLNLNLGGGIFYWDATGNKNTHNGGTVIDPTKAFPADWNDHSQLTTWFTANSSGLGVWRKLLSKDPNILDFGAIGDGTTDDTKAIQAAVSSGLKKVIVSEGVSTIYKLTDSIRISTAGLTLSWDSNLIKFKKFYSPLGSTPAGGGSLISVAAAAVLLENVGLDGNAGSYGGCGIVYESAALYYTYGCRITNPDIRNTKDSCVIFKGSRGAPDIVISGGTMFTWQDPAYAGASSCGYPAIRIVGELDTGGPAPRVFDGVNASSTILLDATGMNGFKVDNCFTGTILYQGNPDVTGGVDPQRTGEGAVTNTYVRDGLVVAGFENSVDTSLSHGHAPLVWDKYGGKPTVFSTFGWEISANSVATKLGSSNVVIYQIKDNSPQGLATLNISSLYTEEIPFLPEWKGSTSNPSIGNGNLAAAYDNVGKFINFRMKLTIGSTTSRGIGEWSFTLPRWANIAFAGNGVWSGYIVGVGRMSGVVVIYNNGAVHEIALLSSDGSTVIGSENPASLPAGSTFLVSFHYLRG